jgi:hypothetical protein
MTALTRRGLCALLLAVLCGLPLSASAATGVTFTLTIKSAFARAMPSFDGQPAASLFQGQTYAVGARTADSAWLRLDLAAVRTEAWVLASLGTINGNLASVPVATPASAAPPATPLPGGTPPPGATPPDSAPAVYTPPGGVIPVVSQTAREIYRRGLQMGANPRAFSKVGDCQSVPPYFLAAFDYGLYNLGPYAGLQGTIDHFSGSWARDSQATDSGFNVATVFVPLWADPAVCLRNESPLACELRVHRPSLVIISMETWWGGDPSGYESYLRRIIELSIQRGAVPILGTKADNIEGNGSINAVIVRLAQEYDLPLWNFWAAVQPLPSQGLHPDGFHLTWERNFYDNPDTLTKAWPVRNLTALQAIDAVWRGLNAP